MVTEQGTQQGTQETVKVEGAAVRPTRKSFTAAIKEPKFYPDLTMEENKDLFIGVPLILWDATIRDWDSAEYGVSQYCILKVSVNDPGKEADCFLVKLGGVAIVSKIKSAKAKHVLPSREGLSVIIGQTDSKDGRTYYCFVDLV
jgi:hypothetical protein